MKKTKYPIMNMGTVSVLTIFIVLCMVTFATLTYISVRKDASFAEQLAGRTTAYYAAVSEANRQIADIDALLRQAWEGGTWQDIEKTYEFSVPIDSEKELQVVLEACSPDQASGLFFRILQFQEVSSAEWTGDTSLPVLQAGDDAGQ